MHLRSGEAGAGGSVARVSEALASGEIEVLGRFTDASNGTFLVRAGGVRAVYKPRAGERPLWDFDDGTLYLREVAAYRVSDALGWGLVPETVLREDAPYGPGSLQRFVDADLDEHYLTLMPVHVETFRKVALFDLLINNADRKSGSCLIEKETARVFVVDHGVCFHVEEKLRTVIWDFAGEPIPASHLDDLRRLDVRLDDLLTPAEIEATHVRATALLSAGAFPDPPTDRRPYPWPPI